MKPLSHSLIQVLFCCCLLIAMFNCSKEDEIKPQEQRQVDYATYIEDLPFIEIKWLDGSRAGVRRETFDRNKYIQENNQLASDTGWIHTQTGFNKDTIFKTTFKRTKSELVGIGNPSVIYGVYNIEFTFDDGTTKLLVDNFTENGPDTWTETPSGINIVPNVGNYLTLKRQFVLMVYYDFLWLRYKVMYEYEISTHGMNTYKVFIPSKLNPNTIFRLQHL